MRCLSPPCSRHCGARAVCACALRRSRLDVMMAMVLAMLMGPAYPAAWALAGTECWDRSSPDALCISRSPALAHQGAALDLVGDTGDEVHLLDERLDMLGTDNDDEVFAVDEVMGFLSDDEVARLVRVLDGSGISRRLGAGGNGMLDRSSPDALCISQDRRWPTRGGSTWWGIPAMRCTCSMNASICSAPITMTRSSRSTR